ncbi:MAG: hypothetical protein JNL32_03455 [Candidatus Kapabacteria bacterium]|nr:hypothetical protein [Candidatus Kapabacteria bacterium]
MASTSCYTRSYWIDLCKNPLHLDLHHNPTEGGNAQAELFRKQHSYTLDLYTKTFDSEPPPDIWLSVDRRFAESPLKLVDSSKYHILKKPILSKVRWVVIASILFLMWVFIDFHPEEWGVIVFIAGIAVFVTLITANKRTYDNDTSGGSGCGTDFGIGHHSSSGDDSGCGGDSDCGGGCGGGCGGD